MSDIEVPQEYIEKSNNLTKIYYDFVTTGEFLDQLVSELRDILVNAGFSRTHAMMKIAEDHKHLRRFSLKNIYKVLPTAEKQQYTKKDNNDDNIFQKAKTLSQNNVPHKEEYKPSSSLEEFRKGHGIAAVTNETEYQQQGEEQEPASENRYSNGNALQIAQELNQTYREQIEHKDQQISKLEKLTQIIRRGTTYLELGSETIDDIAFDYNPETNICHLKLDESLIKSFWEKVYNG